MKHYTGLKKESNTARLHGSGSSSCPCFVVHRRSEIGIERGSLNVEMEGVEEDTSSKGGELSDQAQLRQNVGPPASLSASSRQPVSTATLTHRPHPSSPFMIITRRES